MKTRQSKKKGKLTYYNFKYLHILLTYNPKYNIKVN